MNFEEAYNKINKVVSSVSSVIKDKDAAIRKIISCWLAGGHVLLEDVPGTGKTVLARALGLSTQFHSSRIQFTPDLLPADITGCSIYSTKSEEFHFIKGPVFTDILLADEINRATPRTQAALLQAMAENIVTVENHTYNMSSRFFVIATQNPVEQKGTFILPEAQLDRFMIKISLGYPSFTHEKNIVKSQIMSNQLSQITPVISREEFDTIKSMVSRVSVSDSIIDYVLTIIAGTRNHQNLALGGSTRAAISIIKLSQGISFVHGISYVKPDVIKAIIADSLGHRLVLSKDAFLDQTDTYQILRDITNNVRVPTANAS